MYKLYNCDNMNVLLPDHEDVSLIYCDMIYEDTNYGWLYEYWDQLKKNGIFIVQTDYHTVAEVKIILDNIKYSTFVNWLIYKQEWGGTPKKGFPQKHDDILVYCKGDDFYWNKDVIQIPKATAGTKFDKKGTGLKTPCSVFDDLGNFSTMSKERIKAEDGHNIRWQKPTKLMNRLLAPFTKEGDWILDPFMGSGTTGEWCIRNNRNFIGIEYDPTVFKIAEKRLSEIKKDACI